MQQRHYGRLPNLFVVGAQKAGTTSLFDWLIQHPDICGVQANKETPFFANDELYEQGIDSYARLFPKVVQQPYLMAGSVHYLFFPEALPRLQKHCPHARILVMLRNPVDRAISAYRFAVQRGIENRSFNDAIAEELAAPVHDQAYTEKLDRYQKFYVSRSLYGRQLKSLYTAIPAEKVFVGIFEQMVKQPVTFMKPLYEFLGLRQVAFENNVRNRTKGMPRNQLLNRIYFREELRTSQPVQLLKKVIPHPLRVRVRRTVLKLITNPVEQPDCDISDATRRKLQQVFRDDLLQLNRSEAHGWINDWGLELDHQQESKFS